MWLSDVAALTRGKPRTQTRTKDQRASVSNRYIHWRLWQSVISPTVTLWKMSQGIMTPHRLTAQSQSSRHTGNLLLCDNGDGSSLPTTACICVVEWYSLYCSMLRHSHCCIKNSVPVAEFFTARGEVFRLRALLNQTLSFELKGLHAACKGIQTLAWSHSLNSVWLNVCWCEIKRLKRPTAANLLW